MTRPRGLPILTYHAIGPERSPLATDPARFNDTLARLLAAGMTPIDLEEWAICGRPDATGCFAIAFDDGLRSITTVSETLARSKVPATVFVATDRVGLDNAWPGQPSWVPIEPILTWDELAELRPLGCRVASHGATHAALDPLDRSSIVRELSASLVAIEARIGATPRLLAYPYGRSSAEVRRVAARYYATAFGTTLGTTDSRQDPFDLARIDAYYLRDDRLLSALTHGRSEGHLGWRRALRSLRLGVESLVGRSRRSAA
jgi:peptidoglycan/xylan/chitin deacetylase (PgdA/CDA1 family)